LKAALVNQLFVDFATSGLKEDELSSDKNSGNKSS
jgi:hypothetical protein